MSTNGPDLPKEQAPSSRKRKHSNTKKASTIGQREFDLSFDDISELEESLDSYSITQPDEKTLRRRTTVSDLSASANQTSNAEKKPWKKENSHKNLKRSAAKVTRGLSETPKLAHSLVKKKKGTASTAVPPLALATINEDEVITASSPSPTSSHTSNEGSSSARRKRKQSLSPKNSTKEPNANNLASPSASQDETAALAKTIQELDSMYEHLSPRSDVISPSGMRSSSPLILSRSVSPGRQHTVIPRKGGITMFKEQGTLQIVNSAIAFLTSLESAFVGKLGPEYNIYQENGVVDLNLQGSQTNNVSTNISGRLFGVIDYFIQGSDGKTKHSGFINTVNNVFYSQFYINYINSILDNRISISTDQFLKDMVADIKNCEKWTTFWSVRACSEFLQMQIIGSLIYKIIGECHQQISANMPVEKQISINPFMQKLKTAALSISTSPSASSAASSSASPSLRSPQAN